MKGIIKEAKKAVRLNKKKIKNSPKKQITTQIVQPAKKIDPKMESRSEALISEIVLELQNRQKLFHKCSSVTSFNLFSFTNHNLSLSNTQNNQHTSTNVLVKSSSVPAIDCDDQRNSTFNHSRKNSVNTSTVNLQQNQQIKKIIQNGKNKNSASRDKRSGNKEKIQILYDKSNRSYNNENIKSGVSLYYNNSVIEKKELEENNCENEIIGHINNSKDEIINNINEEENLESQNNFHQNQVSNHYNKNPKKSKNHQELFSEYDYINNSQNKSGEYVNNNFDNKGKDAQLFTNKIKQKNNNKHSSDNESLNTNNLILDNNTPDFQLQICNNSNIIQHNNNMVNTTDPYPGGELKQVNIKLHSNTSQPNIQSTKNQTSSFEGVNNHRTNDILACDDFSEQFLSSNKILSQISSPTNIGPSKVNTFANNDLKMAKEYISIKPIINQENSKNQQINYKMKHIKVTVIPLDSKYNMNNISYLSSLPKVSDRMRKLQMMYDYINENANCK